MVTGEHSPHRKNTVSALNSSHLFVHGIVLCYRKAIVEHVTQHVHCRVHVNVTVYCRVLWQKVFFSINVYINFLCYFLPYIVPSRSTLCS